MWFCDVAITPLEKIGEPDRPRLAFLHAQAIGRIIMALASEIILLIAYGRKKSDASNAVMLVTLEQKSILSLILSLHQAYIALFHHTATKLEDTCTHDMAKPTFMPYYPEDPYSIISKSRPPFF